MKNSVFLLITSVLLMIGSFSCQTPEKLIKKQQYDFALLKLAEKCSKPNPKPEDIHQFQDIYDAENQADHEIIQEMKASGEPDVWFEIAHRYTEMIARYTLAFQLPDTCKKLIHFQEVDLQTPHKQAIEKASLYGHALAKKLLGQQSDSSTDAAFTVLNRVLLLNSDNPIETEQLLHRAIFAGASSVIVEIRNETGIRFTDDWLKILVRINDTSQRIKFTYDQKENSIQPTDIQLIVRLQSVKVTPEKSLTRRYLEKKIEEDNEISAEVTEISNTKSCEINAVVECMRRNGIERTLVIPVQAVSVFNNTYASVSGDLRALSQENLKLMTGHAIPFPAEKALVQDAASEFNHVLSTLVVKNGVVSNKKSHE